MKHGVLYSALAALLLAAWLAPQLVQAQPGPLPPPVSPYLNLLRGGDLANNYYNLVRPQIDYGNSIYGLQQQVTGVSNQVGAQGAYLGAVTTGHPVYFLNSYQYYPASRSRAIFGSASMGSGMGMGSGVGATSTAGSYGSGGFGSGVGTNVGGAGAGTALPR